MKIGIYDPYLDDLGGGEKYMMTIAECLSKDHEVTVFWDDKKDIDELLKRFSLNLSRVSIKKNIFSSNFGFLNRVFESRKYDIMVVLSDGSIPFLLSKKIVLHIQQPLINIEKVNLKTALKLIRIDTIFYNSEYTKTFNRNFLPKKTKIIYPPVRLYPKEIKKKNIILHVGRFRIKNVAQVDDYKKQHIMINSFKEMVDAGLKDWKFLLAVSIKDEDREKFEQMKRETVGYPIEFVINVPNDKLWNFYSEAKIYWHASGFGEDLEKNPERAEHFGISTVEAMGAGAVPVVINAGGQTEIVESNKNGFLWNSLAELKGKTLELINNHVLLEKMSKMAVERANFFGSDKFCSKLLEIIK